MAMLIRFGADPNAVDTNGRTPLIRAIECQDEKLIMILLEVRNVSRRMKASLTL